MASTTNKFKPLLGSGVHAAAYIASTLTLYIGIKKNVDAENLLNKIGIGAVYIAFKKPNRTAELDASSSGALALALLFNQALFPIRVPISVALTRSLARSLARRNLVKTSV